VKYDVHLDPDIDKEYILSRIRQEDIFEHYLQVEVQTHSHFCSPLRKDRHPTCNFSWHNGKLWFRDWAEDHPLDCWQLVMRMYDLDFYEALQKIASDFNLTEKEADPELQYQFEARDKESSQTLIEVKKQDFTPTDVEYLTSYGITSDACKKFYVYSIKRVWINKDSVYTYSDKDPALGYYFGTQEGVQQWKIYFYKRDEFRFICNTNRIAGWPQLPDMGLYVIITKSLKDVMALWEFGIPAIAPQSETQIIEPDRVKDLYSRFQNIFTLYDYDRTGVQTANTLYKKYGIPYLFFDDDYEAKDFSDYVRLHGREKTLELIEQIRDMYHL
jgi:hypothetical protein